MNRLSKRLTTTREELVIIQYASINQLLIFTEKSKENLTQASRNAGKLVITK